jgi:hypothetical protein
MKIATICGSLKIDKEIWDVLSQNLTLWGYSVFKVDVWNMRDFLHTPEGEDVKIFLDEIHKEKILISDKIFILVKDNYIGDSTHSEIEYAKSLNKSIEYINITENYPYLYKPSDLMGE